MSNEQTLFEAQDKNSLSCAVEAVKIATTINPFNNVGQN